ncbi:hypothetical protein BD779DRAFT_1486819 [Infundibulicybe gibba]|nr:hypothetical protein BD779DRAFT_1486819 [Infundibulicybe gibba]
MEGVLKRKVTVKFNYNNPSPTSSSPPLRVTVSRPPSPLKSSSSTQSSVSSASVRPRVKVSATAVSNSTRKPVPTKASGTVSASSTPRAQSPSKPPPRVRNGALSPPTPSELRSRAPLTTGSNLPAHTFRPIPRTPDSRHRALTATVSELGRPTVARKRHGSISLHHAASLSTLKPSDVPSRSGSPAIPSVDLSDQSSTPEPTLKIKAKVSGVAKVNGDSLSPCPSPTLPTHQLTRLTRAPSISSNISVNSGRPPSPATYPITTATPAANPHRFATARPSPPTTSHHYFRPFSQSRDDSHLSYGGSPVAKVDPLAIPLPPQSPPTSALSFSSKSSVSRSSVSCTESADSHSSISKHNTLCQPDNPDLQATLDNLLRYSAMSDTRSEGTDQELDDNAAGEERKVKAEAKSNRKIADLEITNRSLLAINASLETAKHRQAKEIRELRRKLRESRLILPPRTYQAVKSSLDHDDTAESDDNDDNDEQDMEEPRMGAEDEVYKRIKLIIEGLLESGKRALEVKWEDSPDGPKSGTKVLSADEVRSWRDSSGDGQASEQGTPLKPVRGTRRSSAAHIAPSESDYTSEDEVEAMTLSADVASLDYTPPPILITESP